MTTEIWATHRSGMSYGTLKCFLFFSFLSLIDQSERKSSKVNARARKAWPNGVASRPKSTMFFVFVFFCLKPWSSGPASSRKWTQVQLW